MARVLKAKYFKHKPFMDAGKGYRPNFGWTSITRSKMGAKMGAKGKLLLEDW